jgi:DNA mismatch repair ATPase MutS
MTDKQIIIAKELVNSLSQRIKNFSENCIEIQKKNNKLKAQLKAKEQECEELKKIIDEAKNSKLDLKSFLVGEAIQNEYEQQLDQLKAENEELRQFLSKEPLALQALQSAYASYKKSSEVWADIAKDYKQTLAEIKEIAEACQTPDTCKDYCRFFDVCVDGGLPLILKK